MPDARASRVHARRIGGTRGTARRVTLVSSATLVVSLTAMLQPASAQPAAQPAPAEAPPAPADAPAPGPGATPPEPIPPGDAEAGAATPDAPGTEPASVAPPPTDAAAAEAVNTTAIDATPPAPPEDGARVAALEARIAALEAELYATPPMEREVLRIYGFTDVGFRAHWLLDGCSDTTRCLQDGKTPSRFRNVIDDHSTFVLGNVNVYFDAEPVETMRLLTEVRFSQYPQGAESGLAFERQDNEVLDVTSSTGRNHVVWSGIILERAQLEWNRYDAFRVIVGYFLTPYGIWNVDHGTPTLISLALPEFFAQEYFPTHQLGVQALGRTAVGSADLGYHATVSNGRTPGVLDNDAAKALGGRAFLTWAEKVELTIGASGYYSHYNERSKEVIDFEPFRVDSDPSVEYDEGAVGADLAVNAGRTRARIEWALHRIDYVDGLRESPAPTLEYPDRWRQSLYVLVAQELGKTNLEPYVYGEYSRRAQSSDRAASITSLGLNYAVTPFAKLKTQGLYTRFYAWDGPDAPEVRQDDFITWDTRFVMAF